MFVAVVNLCALVARWAASLFFVVVNAEIIITPSIYMIYFEVYILSQSVWYCYRDFGRGPYSFGAAKI